MEKQVTGTCHVYVRSPLAAPAAGPRPPDTPGPCSPPTACIRSRCCPAGGSASQSSSCSGRCSAACAAASAGRAWLAWAWPPGGQRSKVSRERARRGGEGGKRGGGRWWRAALYDQAAALLTLARRQPHHRAERCSLARRWPIPNGVRRGGRRLTRSRQGERVLRREEEEKRTSQQQVWRNRYRERERASGFLSDLQM